MLTNIVLRVILLRNMKAIFQRKTRYAAGVCIAFSMILLLVNCMHTRDRGSVHPATSADGGGNGDYLTPGDIYAAEILSYMLQVVVGAAGDPAVRKAWKTTSLSTVLDLSRIGEIMRDPERRMAELMVYDANTLGLSKVLYHYNQRLNYFKGRALQESVYPSEELLAIRLFMVQKIARGEKVRLGELMAEPELFDEPFTEPMPEALARANLNAEEWRLLRDVMAAEPFFKSYLQDPFLVDAFYRVGLVEMDEYVRRKTEAADYSFLTAHYKREKAVGDIVQVAILPSMTRAFDFQDKPDAGSSLGFQAREDYVLAAETLEAKLRAALQLRVVEGLEGARGIAMTQLEKESRAAGIVNNRLQFLNLGERPLVIYPGNADKVIQSLCPDADFSFIVLGKNVYLSINFEEQQDVFPAVDRIYLDIMDIGQSQSDFEIDQAGEYLYSRLKTIVPEL